MIGALSKSTENTTVQSLWCTTITNNGGFPHHGSLTAATAIALDALKQPHNFENNTGKFSTLLAISYLYKKIKMWPSSSKFFRRIILSWREGSRVISYFMEPSIGTLANSLIINNWPENIPLDLQKKLWSNREISKVLWKWLSLWVRSKRKVLCYVIRTV